MDPRPDGREQGGGVGAATIVDVAGLVGLAGIAAGTIMLAPTNLGFEPSAAIAAILAWLPTTVPIAAVVLAAAIVDIGAGVVLARAARGSPFERLDAALLAGFVATVVKDVALLGLLGGLGLFNQPVLAVVNGAILAAGVVRGRPWLAPGAVPRPGEIGPFEVLVIAAWSAPVLLQAASPIVPFMDVLPNHVAPAEHLRTFGTLTDLTDTQSPIYGPSRVFLGTTALLGAVTTLSGPTAGAALAGFILPSTLLVAVAVYRLATALGGRGAGAWALLMFAMTTSLARLGDSRATVIVLPLIAWALAIVAERLSAEPLSAEPEAVVPASRRPRLALPESVLVGLGLGAAMLVHPVIGFLAVLTVAIVVLVRPGRVAALAIPALGTAAVVALPQAATMAGIGLSPIALALALVVAVGIGVALDRVPAVQAALVVIGRFGVAAVALLAIVTAGVVVRAAVAGATPLLNVLEVSTVAAVMAVGLRASAGRSLVLWAALAAGFGVAAVTQLVPSEGSGLLGDALRFELPKTLQYWVPVFLAILAAGGLAALVGLDRVPVAARALVVAAFVTAAAVPIRSKPIDAFHLGEHRLSETFSIAMRWVERGFFSGFPDRRDVVDASRQELVDAVRAEIEAGRLGPDTPVLHVAASFQMWVATPLGVFTGVTETILVPEPEVSIHTVGGRILPLDDLTGLLAGRRYGFVLLEPDPNGLPPGIRDQIVAAGYTSIFGNGQGELFAAGR